LDPLVTANPELAMNRLRGIAALFVMLALAGCSQLAIGQRRAPSAPYSHEDKGTIHDGGDGGSGGM
jgi:hypothetical protein